MLPFVRGVDLSGNDFKVSRPGVGPTSLRAVSSARARAGLRFLSRPPPGPAPPGTADGAGWGSPRRSRPRPERTPGAPAQGPHGKTRAGQGRADAGARSHAREWVELGAPTPCPSPGVWAPPGPESGLGVCGLLLPPPRPSVPAPLRSHAQARP